MSPKAAAKKIRRGKKQKPAQSSRPAGSRSLLVGAVILLVCALLVAEAFKFFKKPPAPVFITAQLVGQFTGTGQPCGTMGAWDVAALGNDRIVLTDQQNGRIVFFDRSGKYLRSWGKKGDGKKPEDLREPSGVTSDGKNVYFIDPWTSLVIGLDHEARLKSVVALSQGFYGPRGLAWDGQYFYVADTGGQRVVKVSPKDEVAAIWGAGQGSGKNQMSNPRALVLDSKGLCYVADYENSRVQVFDTAGHWVRSIPTGNKITDVEVDSKGRLFASSLDGGFVKMFAPDGKYLGDLKDSNPANNFFASVVGMGMTPDDILLITSGDRVLLYQVP